MTQTGSVAEGRLSDWISLGVLASWVPRDAVDDAVEATGKGAKKVTIGYRPWDNPAQPMTEVDGLDLAERSEQD